MKVEQSSPCIVDLDHEGSVASCTGHSACRLSTVVDENSSQPFTKDFLYAKHELAARGVGKDDGIACFVGEELRLCSQIYGKKACFEQSVDLPGSGFPHDLLRVAGPCGTIVNRYPMVQKRIAGRQGTTHRSSGKTSSVPGKYFL